MEPGEATEGHRRPDGSTPVRPPRQARSRRTLERLTRAALEIIEEEGPDAATVQRIVKRARSSVGSFYARFGSKDDLLDYLDTRVWVRAEKRWRAALNSRSWEGLTLEEVVAGAVKLLADAHEANQAYRVGMGHEGRSDGYRAFRACVLEGIAEIVLSHASRIGHPRPVVAARVGALAVAGAIEAAGEMDTGLREEPERLYLSYLGAHIDGSGREPSVEFFDIWG